MSTFKRTILFVTNLHYDVTEKELEEHLCSAIPVEKVTIFHKRDGTSSGKAEVHLNIYSVAIKHRLNHTKFKGRVMRMNSVYDLDMITGSRTVLVHDLPKYIKAGELKSHFRPPIPAERATIFYNEDGSSTGRGLVVFSCYMHIKCPLFSLILQNRIKGKSMKYSLPIDTDSPSDIKYFKKNYKIFITGLPYNVTSDGLKKHFCATFDVLEASIFCNKDGSSTGTGEVLFCGQKTSPDMVLTFARLSFGVTTTTAFFIREIQHWEGCYEAVREVSQASNCNENATERADYRDKMNEISGLNLIPKFQNEPRKLVEIDSFSGMYDSYKAIRQLKIPQRYCTIYVTNLHVDATSEELKAFFCAEMPIVNAYIIFRKDGTSTETGLVIFNNRRDRLSAFLLLANKEFKGREMKMTCIYRSSGGCWGQPTGK